MENYKKLFPSEYYTKFAQQNVRPDGRAPNRLRKAVINTGSIETTEGSAFVKLGHTSVIAGAKAEVGKPPPNPKDSQIIVNVELTPLCSSKFKSGPPSDQAQVISAQLNKLVAANSLVDRTALTIGDGTKVVWCINDLYIDIYCMDHDGNVFDASLLALLACLKSVRLPSAQLVGSEEDELEVGAERTIELSLTDMPISFTFGIILQDYVVVDPTAEEEDLMTGSFTITTNAEGKIYSISKLGGTVLAEEKLAESIVFAKEKAAHWTKLIQEAVNNTSPMKH